MKQSSLSILRTFLYTGFFLFVVYMTLGLIQTVAGLKSSTSTEYQGLPTARNTRLHAILMILLIPLSHKKNLVVSQGQSMLLSLDNTTQAISPYSQTHNIAADHTLCIICHTQRQQQREQLEGTALLPNCPFRCCGVSQIY